MFRYFKLMKRFFRLGATNKVLLFHLYFSRELENREDLFGYLCEACPGRQYVMMPAIISYLAIGEYFSANRLVVVVALL